MIRASARAAAAIAAIFAGFLLAGVLVEHAPRASGLRDELIALPLTPDLGGATSRVIATDKAYTFLATNSPDARSRDFFFGNRIFNTNWAEYPASVKIFDGLGPTFNRNSCSGCHVRDGRGRPPETAGAPFESMLIRLSALGAGGKPVPHPAYGEQLNDRAILGVPAEGRAIIDVTEVPGTYGDGTPYSLARPHYRFADLAYGPLDGAMVSPRVAPAVIGLGLLEAVPVSDARGARRSRRQRRRRHLRPHQLAHRSRRQAGRRALRLEGQCRHAPRAGRRRGKRRYRAHLEPLPGQELPGAADRLQGRRP